jgi:hypothetical protein
MLTKNTRASVAAVIAALITGLLVTLWLALMPAPAQAQPGDSLQLVGIKAIRIEDWWPDDHDEPMIKIDGLQWGTVLSMKNGDYKDLRDRKAKVLSGANANVQLYEVGPGDTLLGGFVAEYTDGKEITKTINFNNGQATYEITYVVNRSSTPPNTPPEILDLSPTPGSSTQNRTPIIRAAVRDAETDLDGTTIKLFLDGSERTASYNRASDKLTYQSSNLARGQHMVRIEATDASGLKGENTWKFKVVRSG